MAAILLEVVHLYILYLIDLQIYKNTLHKRILIDTLMNGDYTYYPKASTRCFILD